MNNLNQFADIQHTNTALYNDAAFGVNFYRLQDDAARANWQNPGASEQHLVADLNKMRAQIADLIGVGNNWNDKIKGTPGSIEAVVANGSTGVVNGDNTEFDLAVAANWTKEGGGVVTTLAFDEPDYCDFYLNGRRLAKTDGYTIAGNVLTINTKNLTSLDQVVIASRNKYGLTIT